MTYPERAPSNLPTQFQSISVETFRSGRLLNPHGVPVSGCRSARPSPDGIRHCNRTISPRRLRDSLVGCKIRGLGVGQPCLILAISSFRYAISSRIFLMLAGMSCHLHLRAVATAITMSVVVWTWRNSSAVIGLRSVTIN